MDPVTAVNLASNVAQLVELSWKVVSKTREIRKHGALPEHRDAETVTVDLQKTSNKLLGYLQRPEKRPCPDPDDEALRRLCESTSLIAGTLVEHLHELQPNKPRTWKSIRHALKSVWVKSELDETAARLQAYRAQLNTRLMVSVLERIDSLDQETRNLIIHLTDYPIHLAASQATQTDYLTRLISSEHDKTRGAFSHEADSNGLTLPVLSDSHKPLYKTQEEHDAHVAIFEAVQEQSIPKLRNALRENTSSIFARNNLGQTPLHVAAGTGNIDLVEYLISNGAIISPDDNDGKLPLHYAVASGSSTVARALIAKGADSQAQDSTVARALIAKGADSQAQDRGRCLPLDLRQSQSLVSWNDTNGTQINDSTILASDRELSLGGHRDSDSCRCKG